MGPVEGVEKSPEDRKPYPCHESELVDAILECCESAFLNGLPPSKIHQVLCSLRRGVREENDETSSPSSFDSQQGIAREDVCIASSGEVQRSFWPYWMLPLTLVITLACLLFAVYIPASLKGRKCLLPSHPLVMEMVRPIASCEFCTPNQDDQSGSGVVLEFHGVPVREEFRKIAYSSRPIIVRNGESQETQSSNSNQTLTFAQLRKIFESEQEAINTVSHECQFLPFRSPFSSLRHAFDSISENEDQEWKEPWYIGWSNCHPGVSAKLRQIVPRPNFLPSGHSALDWIFIGSPGLGAAMHIDYVRRPSWQKQLSGIKTWNLRPPPECEDVCPPSVQFTIYPGDLLFLETNTWYHETFIEGKHLSISIGSEYD